MIKRIISFLMAFAVAAGMVTAVNAEEVKENTVLTAETSRAVKLLERICEESLFDSEKEFVTRIEFLTALEKVMKLTAEETGENTFSDIEAGSDAAKTVYAALSRGWISEDDNFNPDDAVNVSAAYKMCVCAMGLRDIAEKNGGFPTGYASTASKQGLSEGIKSNDGLGYAEAYRLLFNMLESDYIEERYTYSGGRTLTSYETTGYTYLNKLYDIYKTEGIVNGTSYNSYEYGTPVDDRLYIKIKDEMYEYDEVYPELIAQYCNAYYYDDGQNTGSIVYLDTEYETLKSDLKDIAVNSGSKRVLRYDENNREKEIRLKPSALMFYNGRRLESFDYSRFSGDGYAEFIDNDDDGKYEAVHITNYTYTVVSGTDKFNGRIGDKNGEEFSLDTMLSNRDVSLSIKDSSGNDISIYNIGSGDVLQVRMSEDGRLIRIEVTANFVSGKISGIDGDKYVINGNEYEASEYFKKYYADKAYVGMTGGFAAGYNNRLISFTSGSGKYRYGFLMNISKESYEDFLCIKLFTADGDIKIYNTPQKITVDGTQYRAETALSMVKPSAPTAVKYFINSEGLLSKLDLPEEYDASRAEEQKKNTDNCFIYYPYFTKTLPDGTNNPNSESANIYYRSTKKTFNGYFTAANAVCMKIPHDMSADERYFAKDDANKIFSNNAAYRELYAYDIDEYGYAGMVLRRYEHSTLSAGNTKDSVYVVTDIYEGISNDDEVLTGITCWRKGSFTNFYITEELKNSISSIKDKSASLEPGDVIRLTADKNNVIYALAVDFNITTFDVNSTMKNNSTNYRNPQNSFSNWFGIPYSSNGKFAQLMTAKDDTGNYKSDVNSLKTFAIDTQNIARFDCKTKELRPVSASEIKTYRAFGNDADRMWIVQDCDAPDCIILFDRHEY